MKITLSKIGLFLLPFFLFGSVKAQEERITFPMEEEEITKKQELKAPKPQPRVEALEKAVDPEEYIVGPGDVFSINVWGQVDQSFEIAVTPEGNLVIPTIGTIFVDGMVLREVQKRVILEGARKYRDTKITTNLMALRNLRVHVVGEVVNPGTFIAQAVDRVSDLIDQAGGMREWASEQKIQVKHVDGRVASIDLSLFKKRGELANNPTVNGGDVIYVPPIELSGETVRLEGGVEEPGIYQIATGEKLGDFLLRVNALNKSTNLEEAYLLRREKSVKSEIPSGGQINLMKIDLFHQSDLSNISLKNGDIITLPGIKDRVYVQGAVQKPGAYPYIVDLKARDYVGMAGGTEKSGSLSGVKVHHLADNRTEKGEDVIVGRGDTIAVPLSLRVKITEYLGIATQLATILIAAKAVGLIGD